MDFTLFDMDGGDDGGDDTCGLFLSEEDGIDVGTSDNNDVLFGSSFWLEADQLDNQPDQPDQPERKRLRALSLELIDFERPPEPKISIGNITIRRGSRRQPFGTKKFKIGGAGTLVQFQTTPIVQTAVPRVQAKKPIRRQSKPPKTPAKEKKKKKNGLVTCLICRCRTECLKGYCQCFITSRWCSALCKCNKMKCRNRDTKKHRETRRIALMNYKMRKKDLEYCRCKRNRCNKKYCICLAAGRACNDACKCTDCENR